MPDLFIAKQKKSQPEPSLYPQLQSEKPEAVTSPAPGTVVVEKKEHHPFTAFHRFPEGISFANQESDEKIHLFIRRHFITNIDWLLATLAFSFLPFALLLVQTLVPIELPSIATNYLIILLVFYYLIIFGFAFISYVTWFYNVGIITNLRVIDVDVTSLQSRNVAATAIQDIVDVEYNQKGFLSNVFDYGDVHLQTEGLKANFEYHAVPHPAQIADIVSDLMAGRRNND